MDGMAPAQAPNDSQAKKTGVAHGLCATPTTVPIVQTPPLPTQPLAILGAGISARLIIRTAAPGDRPGFVEVLQAALPELFGRAFGERGDQGKTALLRLASDPYPEGVLWVAAIEQDIVGAMQVSTHRTPGVDILKLLGIFGGHLGLLQGLWATMTLNPFLSKPSEPGLYINYIAIHPEYQRQGIGRAVLQRAIELTMYEGFPQTMTWLPAGNQAALDLHRHLGFTVRRTYRSTLLKRLVGEGSWHYCTRPAAIPVVGLKPVVKTVVN
ncbi:MAG TPA: N-acetyltransferase [bacterium]|nr:N-acetyltransferase [bacterium]